MYIAKLIAPDGFADEKQFSERKSAVDWLTGEGLRTFDGDVERSELYHSGKLIWTKWHPKIEDQRIEASRKSPGGLSFKDGVRVYPDGSRRYRK